LEDEIAASEALEHGVAIVEVEIDVHERRALRVPTWVVRIRRQAKSHRIAELGDDAIGGIEEHRAHDVPAPELGVLAVERATGHRTFAFRGLVLTRVDRVLDARRVPRLAGHRQRAIDEQDDVRNDRRRRDFDVDASAAAHATETTRAGWRIEAA